MLKDEEFSTAWYDQTGQEERRQLWFSTVREHIYEWFNPDGTGRIPQFEPPWREPLWILPALYTGDQEYIDLANRVLAGYNSGRKVEYKHLGEHSGKEFGIFQSNIIAANLHAFGDLMTDDALDVAHWHCNALFSCTAGSAQPDYKFHGANDNMPMMATYGLILGGEAMGNDAAIEHGFWSLNQMRRHLSRCAWLSEYNSSTYTPITLCGAARIAAESRSPEIRELALQIEHRIWAEMMHHFHPGIKKQAGPHCRSYCVDNAGHTHSLEVLFWLAFGAEISGRDPIASYFEPDGKEVIHFCGNYSQNIASYTEMFDFDLHVPEYLVDAMLNRTYPASHKGTSEIICHFDNQAGTVHTTTYMEENFTLGSSTIPLIGGDQTNQMFATFKLTPEVKTFKEAGSLLYKYFLDDIVVGEHETSADGGFTGEEYQKNKGWVYAIQKDNVGLMSCIPNLREAPLETSSLKLSVLFPAHYGSITRVYAGGRYLAHGDEINEPCPVTIEAGEVYIHIVPLLPTNLPRNAAIRFGKQNDFEMLDLINFEGESRTFSKLELSRVMNGMVMTIDSRFKYLSLEEFHQQKSDFIVQDYFFSHHRFLQFYRDDVDFELVYTPPHFGVQTETIDGRRIEHPVYESSMIDVNKLPFMTGKVERNFPHFPWEKLDCVSFENSWMIGSRGFPGEFYDNRAEGLKDHI